MQPGTSFKLDPFKLTHHREPDCPSERASSWSGLPWTLAALGVTVFGVGWLRRIRTERPVRQQADHQQSAKPLYLDGAASWKSYTGPDHARQLGRLPVDSEIVVEAVPESNDPAAVALLYQGSRVGYLPTYLSRSLFGAINAANAAGYQVLLRAKRTRRLEARNTIEVQIEPAARSTTRGNDLVLEVRAALAADVYYWLHLTPQERGNQYFELAWTKTVYQDFYQDRRKALLGNNDSLILPCTFSTASRLTNPYGDRPAPHTVPKHPDVGTFADVHVDGQHIGELRTSMMRRSDEDVLKVLSGCDNGTARLQRWPGNIELRVCIADSDGRLPQSSDPFVWQAERREAEHAQLRLDGRQND